MAREAKAGLKDREAEEAGSSFPSSRHGNLSAASSDDRLKDILQSIRSSKSPGSYGTGLIVSSKLPRFSDIYTLTIASADPNSISANKPVVLSKSVTKWFIKDGLLIEGLFWSNIT